MDDADEKPNVVRTDPSRIMMSDVLRDALPDDLQPDAELASMAQNYVIVVLGRITNATEQPLIGTLESITFQGSMIELEIKVELNESFALMRAAPTAVDRRQIRFTFIELHNDEDVIRFETEGAYQLDGARIVSIDYRRRMSVLLLNLKHDA